MSGEHLAYFVKDRFNQWLEIEETEISLIRKPVVSGVRPSSTPDLIEVPDYLLTYWTRILSTTSFLVLLQILKLAHSDDLTVRINHDRLCLYSNLEAQEQLYDAISELERYGFIKTVRIANSINQEDIGNIYFVSRVTPFIWREHYQSLPEVLKKQHDQFMHSPRYGGESERYLSEMSVRHVDDAEEIIDKRQLALKKSLKKEGKPVVSTKTNSGFVYFIQEQYSGRYKIGRARDLDGRLNVFKVKLPFEIKLIYTIHSKDYVKTEKLFHEHFMDKQANGEWFDLAPEDVAWIKAGNYPSEIERSISGQTK